MSPTNLSLLAHITTGRKWEAAREVGEYRAASFAAEGFVHLSTPAQTLATANRFYAATPDLVLLVIDPARLVSPLRWEDTHGHGVFPHLYGPLNLDAVTAAPPFTPDADGVFRALPLELPHA